MKQERRIIAMDEYGKIHFPNNSNNIWMSANELIEHIQKRYPETNTKCKSVSNYPMATIWMFTHCL